MPSSLDKLGYIDVRRTHDPVRQRIRSRGVPAALQGREIFYTEDPTEASQLIAKALAPNKLTLVPGGTGFAASLHGVRMRDVSLLYLDLRVAAYLEIPASGSYYAVHLPTNGRTYGAVGGRFYEANPVRSLVTSPGTPVTMRFEQDCPHVIVRIERDALERQLGRMLGRSVTEVIEFAPTMDLAAAAATRWHGAVQLLYSEVYHADSLVKRGVGIGPLEEFLMSTLILLQPSSHHDQLVRPVEPPGRRAVRRAIEYIESHLSEPITVEMLARHVAMSTRSIQQGFRDELGTSPTAYIRDRRLERVRGELADALPSDGVTVTDVAMRWGFHHLGSFSVLYRKRFGESPSQTLRR